MQEFAKYTYTLPTVKPESPFRDLAKVSTSNENILCPCQFPSWEYCEHLHKSWFVIQIRTHFPLSCDLISRTWLNKSSLRRGLPGFGLSVKSSGFSEIFVPFEYLTSWGVHDLPFSIRLNVSVSEMIAPTKIVSFIVYDVAQFLKHCCHSCVLLWYCLLLITHFVIQLTLTTPRRNFIYGVTFNINCFQAYLIDT